MPVEMLTEYWRPGSRDDYWTWRQECEELFSSEDEARDFADTCGMDSVLLGDDGRVWDGHHRICAAIILGVKEIPYELGGVSAS